MKISTAWGSVRETKVFQGIRIVGIVGIVAGVLHIGLLAGIVVGDLIPDLVHALAQYFSQLHERQEGEIGRYIVGTSMLQLSVLSAWGVWRCLSGLVRPWFEEEAKPE